MRLESFMGPVIEPATIPPLCAAELECARQGNTYNEFCEQYGITDKKTLAMADELDGYSDE